MAPPRCARFSSWPREEHASIAISKTQGLTPNFLVCSFLRPPFCAHKVATALPNFGAAAPGVFKRIAVDRSNAKSKAGASAGPRTREAR